MLGCQVDQLRSLVHCSRSSGVFRWRLGWKWMLVGQLLGVTRSRQYAQKVVLTKERLLRLTAG